MIMVVAVVVVMMALIRIDSLLCLPSSTKLANLAQRAQYLRLTIAGAPASHQSTSFQSLHTMGLSLTGMNFVQKSLLLVLRTSFLGSHHH